MRDGILDQISAGNAMKLNFSASGSPQKLSKQFREEGLRLLAAQWIEDRVNRSHGNVELGELSDIAFDCDLRLEVKFEPNKKGPLSMRGLNEKTQNGPG